MSSFTKHTAISPTENGKWMTTEWFRYYVGTEYSGNYIDVPAWFEFDWASVPSIFGIFIQKVESDTITSACLHDYIYLYRRDYWLIEANRIFLESLLIKNIPYLIAQRMYMKALVKSFKYVMMYIGLLIGSWFVWYKVEKKIKDLFWIS